MKHGKRRLLGALLAGASVMGIVAPSVNAMAATIDDETNATAEELKAVIGEYSVKLDKNTNFANYHRVRYAAERLSKYDAAKSQEVIASISKYDKEVFTSDVVKILDKMDSFAQTKKMQLFDELLQTDIPSLAKENAENADYLKGRLDVWGQALVFAADPEYSKATDAIMQVRELTNQGLLMYAEEQVGVAKEAIKAIKTYDVNGAYLESKLKIEEDAIKEASKQQLTVTSVKALDGERIEIMFNKDVDTTWVENAYNYTLFINGKDASDQIDFPELQDYNCVWLYMKEGEYLENGETFKVDVNNLVDANFNKMEPYKGEYITFNDKEPAQLIKTIYNGSRVEFKFNEYIDATAKTTVKIDNKTIDKNKIIQFENTVRIELDDKDDTIHKYGEHSASISGLTDAAGNVSDLMKSTFTVNEETEKPKVTGVETMDDNRIKVKFNTKVIPYDFNELKDNLSDYVEIKKGSHKFSSEDFDLEIRGNKKEWRIRFKQDVYSGTNCLYEDDETKSDITVKVKDYKTTNNVEGDEFVKTLTFNKDEKSPEIINEGTNLAEYNKLAIYFNEDLSEDINDLDLGKITVTRDGIKQNIKKPEFDKKGYPLTTYVSGSEVVLDLEGVTEDDPLEGGMYTITFEKGAVKDLAGNKNVAGSTKLDYTSEKGRFFTIKDNAITVNGGKVKDNKPEWEWKGDKNVIRVKYDKKMTDSALDSSNYKVHGTKLSDSSFAGTTISFVDENKKDEVEITLGKGNITKDNEEVDMILSQNIRATDGSYVVGTKNGVVDEDKDYKTQVELKDDTAPEVDKVEFIKDKSDDKTSNILKITFTEDIELMKDKDIINDFKIKNGDDTIDIDSVTKGSEDDTLIIKLNKKINVNTKGKVTVEITDKHDDNDDDINITDRSDIGNLVESTDPIKVTDEIVEGEFNKLPEAKIEYKATDKKDASTTVTGVSKNKIVTAEATLKLTKNYDNVDKLGISLTKGGTDVLGITLDDLKTTGIKLGKEDHSEDGVYVFTVVDKYNNKTSVEITIDTTAPVVDLTTQDAISTDADKLKVVDNKCEVELKDNVKAAIKDNFAIGEVKIQAPDAKEADVLKVNEKTGLYEFSKFEKSGDYVLTVTDKAGNITTITITVK